MLTQDGDVKVADFGLARILYGDDPQLTRAGTTLGTPMYMSPEQIQEGEVDIRSDLYSLGVTLYHMLTGRPPFTGETPLALAMQHVQATVPEMSQFRNGIPDSLDQLVMRLLRKSPSERFDGPKEVLDYLREHRDQDLVDDWPDQTVPLPGATAATGPLQATLQLQSRLRKQKHRFVQRVVKSVGATCILGGAFLAGNLLTFSSPQKLLQVDTAAEPTIEQLASVEQQYRWALFDTTSNRVDKWRAVERYFPRDESEINRFYGDLARLQLARVHQDTGDSRNAERELQGILEDSRVQDVVKARAWLQLASLHEEKQNEAAMLNAVRQAKAIRDSEFFNVKDREQLDAAVRQMSGNLPMLWLD
jgi:serine/threonine-protein kinase